MTRAQAEQIIQGYTAQCESGVLDWGWVDMADGPCRSFLFLNRDYCSEPCEASSCFGMSDFVNEGENLADYMKFMTNAIDRPGEVDAEINELKDRFLAEGDPNSQYEAAKELIKDPDCFPALQPSAAEDFARLLLNSAACAGHPGAVSLASEKGWDLDLNDLKFLSDSTAEALSKHKGDLYLERLDELSDAAAAALAKHQGALMLGGVTKLSEAGAEALAKHPNLVVNEDVEAVIGKYRKFSKQDLIDIFKNVFVGVVPADYLNTDPGCQGMEKTHPGVADEFICMVYLRAGVAFSTEFGFGKQYESRKQFRLKPGPANEIGIKKIHAAMDEIGYPWGNRDTPLLSEDLGEYAGLFKFFVDYLNSRIAAGG